MVLATNLGFPRIGPMRELKKAVEAYWKGKSSKEELNNSLVEFMDLWWIVGMELFLESSTNRLVGKTFPMKL